MFSLSTLSGLAGAAQNHGMDGALGVSSCNLLGLEVLLYSMGTPSSLLG